MIDKLLEKIMSKSESIGRWIEFLDKLEDWSNPYVTIGQNHIKRFKEEREEFVNQLKEYINEQNCEN